MLHQRLRRSAWGAEASALHRQAVEFVPAQMMQESQSRQEDGDCHIAHQGGTSNGAHPGFSSTNQDRITWGDASNGGWKAEACMPRTAGLYDEAIGWPSASYNGLWQGRACMPDVQGQGPCDEAWHWSNTHRPSVRGFSDGRHALSAHGHGQVSGVLEHGVVDPYGRHASGDCYGWRESNTKQHEAVSECRRWPPPILPSPLEWAMARQQPAAGRRGHMNCSAAVHPTLSSDSMNANAHAFPADQWAGSSNPDGCRQPVRHGNIGGFCDSHPAEGGLHRVHGGHQDVDEMRNEPFAHDAAWHHVRRCRLRAEAVKARASDSRRCCDAFVERVSSLGPCGSFQNAHNRQQQQEM